MNLSEFLLSRIAEDEEAARAAAEEVDRLNEAFAIDDPKWRTWSRPFASVSSTGPISDFVDRQTPARVLAECEAKRQIVETARQAMGLQRVLPDLEVDGYVGAMGDVLKFLALPYADHPDYDESWRP